MPLRLSVSWLCLFILVLGGCAHYRLGTGGTPGFASLYIAPVENATPLPQAVALVSTQVREAFLRDGRVMLVGAPEQADATLTISLDKFTRRVTTVRPDDTGLARKFDLDLDATATLRDLRSGRLLFENRPLKARRQIFTDSGQLQAEYQVLPLLAETLAERVTHAVLDVW